MESDRIRHEVRAQDPAGSGNCLSATRSDMHHVSGRISPRTPPSTEHYLRNASAYVCCVRPGDFLCSQRVLVGSVVIRLARWQVSEKSDIVTEEYVNANASSGTESRHRLVQAIQKYRREGFRCQLQGTAGHCCTCGTVHLNRSTVSGLLPPHESLSSRLEELHRRSSSAG
jgi:hypothetical protein